MSPLDRMRIAVLGSNGFVGSNVVAAGRARGLDIWGVTTVRITCPDAVDAGAAADGWRTANPDDFRRQVESLRGFDVVVNTAGAARPGAGEREVLLAANVVQPAVAARAAREAGVRRFVHVSSAAVQGRLDPLDETSRHAPLTPYGRSKAAGERWLFDAAGRGDAVPAEIVVYRPTSVHGAGRPPTRALARLAARLPAFPLGGAGDQPVPVALIGNVAAGIVHAATMAPAPPIVLQPWEGLTCRGLLELFGARRFVRLPKGLVRAGVVVARGVRAPGMTARLRWLELTLAGQEVDAAALATTAFDLPLGRDAWVDLVEQERLPADVSPTIGGTIRDSRRPR